MSTIEKLLIRVKAKPKDLTWSELVKVLSYYGYEEISTGKTAGSRRAFANKAKQIIRLHKPHPGDILKSYQIKDVLDILGI
ncbi:type II toxin-antitoxin system HicA family toxin [Spirosoma litoris]